MELLTRTPVTKSNNIHLLFVHGAWHGAWCWDEYYMKYFADHGYTCHALDLSGHGKRSVPGKRLKYRMKDYVNDIKEAVDQLQVNPVIISHSMGGFVLQKYLEKYDVPAAVLLATMPSDGVFFATIRKAIRHPLAFLKVNLFLRLYPMVGTPELSKEAFFEKNIEQEKLEKYFSQIQDESYLGFLDMLFLNLPKPQKKSGKMLVCGLENDTFVKPKEIIKTANAYGADYKIFPGMSHDLMVDGNWKEPADYVISWLGSKGF